LDSTDHQIDCYHAVDPKNKSQTFPLISYAHGDGGGGAILNVAYGTLLHKMASFGYVICATRSCNKGCHDDTTSLPHDPRGFGHFYLQQLDVLEWAKVSPVTPLIDFSKGVGIAGHSMGGQATVYSSSLKNTSAYEIKAAVMHHAYTHSYPAPLVPFLAFTGAKDTIAPPRMTEDYFNAKGANPIRGLVNKESATHHEPDTTDYNPLLAQFSAAWFKMFLDKTPSADGFDYHEMIFGKGTTSVCNGGDGAMKACEMHPPA
jgi:hypothetical protein